VSDHSVRSFAALRVCEFFNRSRLWAPLLHTTLILRSVAQRSVSKDGDLKDGAKMLLRA
jgi:hypothetical protein